MEIAKVIYFSILFKYSSAFVSNCAPHLSRTTGIYHVVLEHVRNIPLCDFTEWFTTG